LLQPVSAAEQTPVLSDTVNRLEVQAKAGVVIEADTPVRRCAASKARVEHGHLVDDGDAARGSQSRAEFFALIGVNA